MRDVEGKVAFITGGASGVGLGQAKVFAQAGAKIVLADVRAAALDDALGQLHGIGVLRQHGKQPDLHRQRHVGHVRRATRMPGELLT